ncbi:hypothetical protein [Desulfolutivibrio sulfoxidireducens]|uniref:hypothetical protein n=1 Tax=Desulfolutivibrio sulfoxidireducens TaxID=2773299 RepID=UPI00159DC3EB|nr:hypothetical protein [Desulfolutivibrio sulfoxidireducens]QLA17727.1 hypothetical protein GD605_17395 [Desulfolutivibrio sulfoxidireducens]QLA21301.1 hypothetical protein GD604_17005 [Desulfolutivibrio sulfoxidireducens]
MAVSAVGRTPYLAYARESAKAEPSSPQARIVTTEVGFRLGRFGLSYTSKDVELLSQDTGQASQDTGFSVTEPFEAILEGAVAAGRMFDAALTPSLEIGTSPLASRQRAIAAYAAVEAGLASSSASRTLLATA